MEFNFLSILASTLFTFKDNACENERLRIGCPAGTTISVQYAKYGRTQPSSEMCPFSEGSWSKNGYPAGGGREDLTCLADTSLKVVQDHCQDKQQCRVLVSAQTFGGDPCPGTSKYLEIAYQCRPNEFRSRTICENDLMSLQCDERKMRLAIYSAMFGRTQGSTSNCPSAPAYDAECQAECALEVVMQRCHGKRQCDVTVNTRAFGDPCQPGTPKYLSVVYTCVSRRILREISSDEVLTNSFCKDHVMPATPTRPPWDGWEEGPGGGGAIPGGGPNQDDGAPVYAPSTLVMTTATTKNNDLAYTVMRPHPGVTEDPRTGAVQEPSSDFFTDILKTYAYISGNEERLTLYSLVSVLFGIILVLIVIIIRLLCTRRRSNKRAKLEISEAVAGSNSSSPPAKTVSDTNTRATENASLLGSEDATLSNDGIEMLSFHHNPSAFNRSHYSTTPKTFGTPNNNNNHNHTRMMHTTSTLSHTAPPVSTYSPLPLITDSYTPASVSSHSPPFPTEDALNQYKLPPGGNNSRTASLPRRYDSLGSRTYDNFYR